MQKLSYDANGNATTFTGEGVEVFRLAVLASALKMYGKCGMRANRAYTPAAMLAAATAATGNKYKRAQRLEFLRAAIEVTGRMQALKARLQVEDTAAAKV